MIPFANATVTLYHSFRRLGDDGKVRTMWARSVHHGCRLFSKPTLTQVGDAFIVAHETTVQIPGTATAAVGDLIIKDECDIEIPENGVAEQLLAGALKVQSVSDNTGAPLAHIALGVK